MYECKDCGRKATEEQVYSAAEQCKDLNAMVNGVTPWLCNHCYLKSQGRTEPSATPLQLTSTPDLVNELLSRFDNIIIATRMVPIQGENEAQEGYFHRGDYRLCQGLAVGMQLWLQGRILLTLAKRMEEEAEE